MEKRIELEKRLRTPDQLTELNLDNCRSTSIEGLTDEFLNLKNLSLNGVGLTSLKGFPKLPKLNKLELSDNRISGGLHILKDCPKLSVLNLSNNKVASVDTLESLKELEELKSLDLYRNDVTQVDDYRDKVFDMLPSLQYLDGADKNGKEYASSSDLEDEESKDVNGKDDDDEDVEDEEDDEEEEMEEEEDVDDGNEAEGDEDEEEGEGEDYDDDEGDEEESEDEDKGATLKDIYRDDLDKESDGEDYEESTEEDDDDEDEDLDDTREEVPDGQDSQRRGTKRPHEGDDAESD